MLGVPFPPHDLQSAGGAVREPDGGPPDAALGGEGLDQLPYAGSPPRLRPPSRTLAAGGEDESVEGRVGSVDLGNASSRPTHSRGAPSARSAAIRSSACRGGRSDRSRIAPEAGISRPASRRGTGRSGRGLERLAHHVSPITGVVTALTSREAAEGGVTHSCVAGHFFPVRSGTDRPPREPHSAERREGAERGPGQDGAVCEAIERNSGIAWGDEPRRRRPMPPRSGGRPRTGAPPVQRGAVRHAGRVQCRERQRLPRRLHRFDESARISWSPAWSLTHQRVRYLPTAYCFYGFTDPGYFFTRATATAARRTHPRRGDPLRAPGARGARCRRALVVQPAAPARGRRGELRPRSLRRASKSHYSDVLHRDLHALDLTSDLGIPAIAVVSRCLGRPVEDVILGFAAHVDPVVALAKALEEANQYLPAVQQRATDGTTAYRLATPETVRWWKTATFENQPYLVADPGLAPAPAGRFPVAGDGGLRHGRRGLRRGRPAPRSRGPRRRPDEAGHRAPGGEGRRARATAFLETARAGPALRRSRGAGLAEEAALGRRDEPDLVLRMTRRDDPSSKPGAELLELHASLRRATVAWAQGAGPDRPWRTTAGRRLPCFTSGTSSSFPSTGKWPRGRTPPVPSPWTSSSTTSSSSTSSSRTSRPGSRRSTSGR